MEKQESLEEFENRGQSDYSNSDNEGYCKVYNLHVCEKPTSPLNAESREKDAR